MEILSKKHAATLTGICVVLLVALVTSFWIFDQQPAQLARGAVLPTTTAKRGVFDINIVTTAVIDARRSITLSSDLPSNKAKVVDLAPEGVPIRQGDIVASFDPTPFEEAIEDLNQQIQQEQTQLLQEQAELELQDGAHQDRLDKLEYQLELAELNLAKLRDSDIPLRLARAENELGQAKSAHESARQALNSQQELFAGGFTTRNKLQEAEDEERARHQALAISRTNTENLRNIELPGEIKRAELQVRNRQTELASAERSLQQKRLQQNAAVFRSKTTIENLQQRLRKEQSNLEKTVIAAPVSGLVLYKDISFQNENRKVQIGDSLWNRHGFAVIPDLTEMIARTRVRESDISKVQVGLGATVTPEAYPDMQISGTITSIGTLTNAPDDQNSINYFDVAIELDGGSSQLRPGMSAKAVIQSRHYDDVIYIPVEAVFYNDNNTIAWVRENGAVKPVDIQVGPGDGVHVVVESGLAEGDELLLAMPVFENADSDSQTSAASTDS